jgi:hypothetical protein
MRWQAGKSHREREATKVAPFQILQALVTKPKNKRKLTEEEIFSKLYYNDKIKAAFEDECEKRGLERKDKTARMEVHHRVTKDSWKEAGNDKEPEIRENVHEEKAKRDARLEGQDNVHNDLAEVEVNLEQKSR